MSAILDKAIQKQQELSEQIAASEVIQSQRPGFHFATPGGWCNDPNGFSQFDGKLHLFYQFHPYSTKWGPMHWGHVISEDMLAWKLEPAALAPDSEADCSGCFSGTALEQEGKHLLVYTGVSSGSSGNKIDIQNQCIAFGDGRIYKKIDENPVLTAKDIPFEYNIQHFRDPKIWKKDNKFYLLCVIKQKNDCGAMVLFESSDAIKWLYKGILDSSKDGLSKMWECPDFSVIDGKDVLIFSPQEMKADEKLGFHDGNNSVYITGVLDYQKCKFIRERRPENGYTAALIDYGIDFYAPETTKLSDGRIIMIGWMQAWESYITPEDYIWSGMMTLPRELSFKNNRLYQQPVRELENWKTDKQSFELSAGTKTTLLENQKRHFEIDLFNSHDSFQNKKDISGDLCLILGDTGEQILLKIDFVSQTITFNRENTKTPGSISSRQVKLRTDNKSPEIKIICDTCSMEVFIDEGLMTFTNTFFFTNTESDLLLENNTSEKIVCKLWKIQNPVK